MINPTKLQQREDTNEFISMSLGLVLKAGGKPTKPLLVLGKDVRSFLRGGEKKKCESFQSHASAWEDYSYSICSPTV